MKTNRFLSIAAMLCALLLFSCTTDIEPPPPPLPQEPSSSSAGGLWSYCVYIETQQCFSGNYSVCPGTGGLLGNSCPFTVPSSSSLAEVVGSSSSSQVEQSNSSSSNGNAVQSSSSDATQEYGYCVFDAMCLNGPVSVCPPGGTPSNVCPYSSSSSAAVSSPSVASSSSSKPFSSSSGSVCINSGSYCNYGGCSAWSSDGWSCSLHINGWANEGGCYPMPTDDNCSSGTLVSVCPANAVPPASNYCRLPSSSSTMASSSSSSSPVGTSGTFTDIRDGLSKRYKWVKIGTQVWMAENLNYAAAGSKCGNGSSLSDANTSTCDTYGRLYNWATAMSACPEGWHLPSDAEWDVLMTAVGGSSTAGRYLKATSGWNGNGNGTDAYGFAALPGGYGGSDGSFSSVGNYGYWWSAMESNAGYAYSRSMGYDGEGVNRGSSNKIVLVSVRCLQD